MQEGIRITNTGTSEVIIKKSRFLGIAENVESDEDARTLVAAVRKEHYSARHVCYAYSIGETNPQLKFSDDGEPGGTAGKPILDVITNSGISNIVIIVVRYFGGVLLGTGGLVRAYTEAAAEAVKNAEKKNICLSNIYDIAADYSDFDKIKYLLENVDSDTPVRYEVSYTDKININAIIPEKISEALLKQIVEKTAGRTNIEYKEQRMM